MLTHATALKQDSRSPIIWTLALMVLGALLVTSVPSTVIAEDAPPASLAEQEKDLDSTHKLAWNREWSLYASRYFQYEGKYYACAKYVYGMPNSVGLTAQILVDRATQTRTVQLPGNMSREVSITPYLPDAQVAAIALPSLDFGDFGRVQSVEVVQVTGPEEMIVKEIWLIDAGKLKTELARLRDRAGDRADEVDFRYQFRIKLAQEQQKQRDFKSQPVLLKGFDTKRIKAGDRWEGPEGEGFDIAITGPDTIVYTREGTRSSRPRALDVMVALPVNKLAGRLTREEFLLMLASRGLTLEQFLDISKEEKMADPKEAIFNTIRRVEEKKPTTKSILDKEEQIKADLEQAAKDAAREAAKSAPRESRSSRTTRTSTRRSREQAAEKADAPAESSNDNDKGMGNEDF